MAFLRTERRVPRSVRLFHEDDGGFSTVGMVLAMLVALSLIFASAQVCRVQSASANVQNVADAAALAAENQVASFYIVANTADALVLTMSLCGICTAGLGVVCACVPFAAGLSVELENAALKIFQARNRFSEKASESLNRLQRMLPFLAAAQAYSIAGANSGPEGSYLGCAVLLPFQGEPLTVKPLQGSDQVMAGIQAEGDAIRDSAAQAEEAAEEALACKKAAFLADCGNAPDYCMQQRAETLAGLAGSQNPFYSSVDGWSFSVPLKRARAYYRARAANEAPADGSVEEQARSAIRKNFFQYAARRVGQGYAAEDLASGSFAADFPLLPKNTQEMRGTDLYTDPVYPVTRNGDGRPVMHAWEGCPQAASQEAAGTGSVSMLEEGAYPKCPACGFDAASVGTVASASSSISNGFEYHYRIVAGEAGRYREARERLAPHQNAVKSKAGGLLDSLGELARDAVSARIDAMPPGRYGAVAVVACVDGVAPDALFPSAFVSGSGVLGARAAVSAATLAEDDSSEAKTAITELLSGFEGGAGGSGAASVVLRLWSGLLSAYADGHDALVTGVREALGKLPLVGKSGLGDWAADKLQVMIADIGLEPAEIHAYKPVTVNTGRVAQADTGGFSQALLSVKAVFSGVPATGSPLAALLEGAGSFAGDAVVEGEQRLLVAVVELAGIQGGSASFSIALPPSVAEGSRSAVEGVFARLGGLVDSVASEREWK